MSTSFLNLTVLKTEHSFASLDKAAFAFLNEEKLSLESLNEVIDQVVNLEIDSVENFNDYLEKVLTIAIIAEKEQTLKEKCDPLYLKAQSNSLIYLHSHYRWFYPVIALLLGKKESYLFLNHPDSFSFNQIDHSTQSIRLVLELFLAIKKNQTDHFSKLLLEIREHQKQIPYLESLFLGVWAKEGEFSEVNFFALEAILYMCAGFYSDDQSYQIYYDHFCFRLKEAVKQGSLLSPYIFLIASFLEKKLSKTLPNIDKGVLGQKIKKEKDFGVYHVGDFYSICRLSQHSCGFMSVKKADVEVLSIGPQIGSIGDMRFYGATRSLFNQESNFPDVSIQESKECLFFNAWMRLSNLEDSQKKLGHTWMNVEAVVENREVSLQVKWESLFEKQELSLLFFIKAEKAIVDKNFHLHPDTLDRYEGKSAELSFMSDKVKLDLKSSSESQMKVIPLSGGKHFWGAKFLVAFSVVDLQTLSFKIS